MARVGLIAGIGILPVEFMRAAHLLGHEVVVIAVVSDYDTTLEQEADVFYHISVAKVGKIFKTLQKEQVKDITMLGKVTKELLFKGLTFPDMKTLSILKTALELIRQNFNGKEINLDELPLDDEKTFEIFLRGETNGLSPLNSMPPHRVFCSDFPVPCVVLAIRRAGALSRKRSWAWPVMRKRTDDNEKTCGICNPAAVGAVGGRRLPGRGRQRPPPGRRRPRRRLAGGEPPKR